MLETVTRASRSQVTPPVRSCWRTMIVQVPLPQPLPGGVAGRTALIACIIRYDHGSGRQGMGNEDANQCTLPLASSHHRSPRTTAWRALPVRSVPPSSTLFGAIRGIRVRRYFITRSIICICSLTRHEIFDSLAN